MALHVKKVRRPQVGIAPPLSGVQACVVDLDLERSPRRIAVIEPDCPTHPLKVALHGGEGEIGDGELDQGMLGIDQPHRPPVRHNRHMVPPHIGPRCRRY